FVLVHCGYTSCIEFFSSAIFFFQAEDGIRDFHVTGVQTCALPIFGYKTGVKFTEAKQDDSGVTVTLESGETLEGDVLLVAVGRGPNTAGHGYEEAGIQLDRGFVVTDERLRTNQPNVYAVGDIVPGLQLAHRGFQQGVFVAEEIAGLNPSPIDEAGIPRVTYSHPEVASVGLTEAAAKETYGAEVQTFTYDLGGNGK